MRVVALARFSNFFTGFRSSKPGVPAKLFQVSTRRLIGHSAVALLSSFWLAKAARLSCAAGAAAWAVMLLSVSIVNVVMVVLLGWEAPWRPRSRSSMADRGRQPDVVPFQPLRPQLVLLDGGAGVVAPMAFRDLARLADSDRHPYRAVAAAGVHRDQDRQPQLGVVLDLESRIRASPASWSASWSVPSACLLARLFITLKPTTIKAILEKGGDVCSARFQTDAATHEDLVIHFEFS